MSILDLDDNIDLREYYSNKLIKYFTEFGPHDIGIEMMDEFGRRRKIYTRSVFCDTPLEYILDRPDIFHLYYMRKYSQIDIHLVVLDSRNIEMIRKFENVGWHKVIRKGNGWTYVPVTMEYILNYEPA